MHSGAGVKPSGYLAHLCKLQGLWFECDVTLCIRAAKGVPGRVKIHHRMLYAAACFHTPPAGCPLVAFKEHPADVECGMSYRHPVSV